MGFLFWRVCVKLRFIDVELRRSVNPLSATKQGVLFMTDNKRNIKTKIAAGAMMVALSGFVPKVTRPVHAATATISASGTFSSGITLTAGNNLAFGKMVATAITGSFSVDVDNATTGDAFTNGGTVAAGSVLAAFGAALAIDVTVTGFAKSIALTGAGATGSVSLSTIKLSGPFTATTPTLTFKAATTKVASSILGVTKDLSVGGQIKWDGTVPVGAFTQAIKIVMSY